jgi:hypothetical protein
MSLRDCTCNCMDCIEGIHCGYGYPNPDGTPTICLYGPGRVPSGLAGDSHEIDWEEIDTDWQERMSEQEFFDLVEGY